MPIRSIRNNDVFVHVIFMYTQATVQFRLKFNVLYYFPLFGLVGSRNLGQNHFLAIDRYQSVLSSTFFSQKENFILGHVEKEALCRSHKMIQAVELNQCQETLQSLFQGNPKSGLRVKLYSKNNVVNTMRYAPCISILHHLSSRTTSFACRSPGRTDSGVLLGFHDSRLRVSRKHEPNAFKLQHVLKWTPVFWPKVR